MDKQVETLERNILRALFESVSTTEPLDNSISDNKIVRQTKEKLKVALRGSPDRCTCAKRTWGGPCEVCQASDNEIVYLRYFYRVIQKAKKHDMNEKTLKDLVGHSKKSLALDSKR